MNISNSMTAIKIQNNMERLNNQGEKSVEKLASGIRINRASDDASGLKISEKMRAQIKGLDMSIDNATDGISMIQTADGGLSKISDILHRMNELSIKAVNGVNSEQDLEKISIEYEECKREIDRIAETTSFNGKKLLNINTGETKITEGLRKTGTAKISARSTDQIDFSTVGDGNEFIVKKGDQEYKFVFSYGQNKDFSSESTKIHLTGKETNQEKAEKLAETIEETMGDVRTEIYLNWPDDGKNYTLAIISLNKIEGETIDIETKTNAPIIKIGNNFDDKIYLTLRDVTTSNLGIDETNVLTLKETEKSTQKILDAMDKINEHRAKLGTTQNQIEYAIKRITIEKENTEASDSRIRDVDMAKEMVKSARTRIIQETAISMLAQANQSNDSVLVLLTSK